MANKYLNVINSLSHIVLSDTTDLIFSVWDICGPIFSVKNYFGFNIIFFFFFSRI